MLGDSTKIRGLGIGEMNNVRVLLSDGGYLLHLGVNCGHSQFEAEGMRKEERIEVERADKQDSSHL